MHILCGFSVSGVLERFFDRHPGSTAQVKRQVMQGMTFDTVPGARIAVASFQERLKPPTT